MSLQEIYQEVLLAHNENPNNFFKLENPSHQSHGNNPLCGDEISVFLKIKDNKIEAISFTGEGCAICKASASLMTVALKGLQTLEAEKKAKDFIELLSNEQIPVPTDLGEMEALLGASARYATANIEALKQLAWNTEQIEILEKSLDQTIGVPEVPGSYYTPRHIVNAARKVVNDQEDARETLIDYTRKINEELTRKRQEFNLPVAED